MADGDGERLCRFIWRIENPFFPKTPRISEATFYHGSSDHLTLWTLTLHTIEYRLHYIRLLLCLSGERYGEPDGVIATRRLVFLVYMNDRETAFEEADDYVFSPGNRHSICREMGFPIPPEKRTPVLFILVEIILPEVANQEGNPPIYSENALKKLSDDMRYLFSYNLYPNMWVRAADLNTLSVHSYILHARCSHFFREHLAGDPVGQTIETDIKRRVLYNTLFFVYYGGLNFIWGSDNEMTEMIQMIDKYKMYHLYRIFVADEMDQERTTEKDYSFHIMNFTLEARFTDELTYPWQMDLRDPNVKFLFELRVCLRDDDDPWYSYSMQATVNNRVPGFVWTRHVQVNFEFLQTDATTTEILKIKSMHESDYIMRSTQPVESGPCYFEEARSEMIAFLRRRQLRHRSQFRHSIRCLLGFSNGYTVTRLQTIHRPVPNYFLETLKVLGYELSRLLTGDHHQDLRVVCKSDDPLRNEREVFRLHKGIFAARVRRWRNAILDARVGDVLPDKVRCIVGSRAFHYVLHYIYTGTLPVVPRHLYWEVVRFADRCQMSEFLEYCHNHASTE